MKLIKKIEGIVYMWPNKELYVKKKGEGLHLFDRDKLSLLVSQDIETFVSFAGGLIFNVVGDPSTIFFLKPGARVQQILHQVNEEFNLSRTPLKGRVAVYFNKPGNYTPDGMYLIDSDLKVSKQEKVIVSALEVGHRYFSWSRKEIVSASFDNGQEYRVDVTRYGRSVNGSGETKEMKSGKPNELDGAPLANDLLLFAPLRGGQLLAIHQVDGSFAWMLDQDISGVYALYEGSIYKKDAKSVFEISSLTGSIIREQVFGTETFMSSGPLWVYRDIIIIPDVLTGQILLLNRVTLEPIDEIEIGQKLPNDKNAIAWAFGKLFVLDLENTLHIFAHPQNL